MAPWTHSVLPTRGAELQLVPLPGSLPIPLSTALTFAVGVWFTGRPGGHHVYGKVTFTLTIPSHRVSVAGVLEQVWGSSMGQLLVRGSPLAWPKLPQSCSAI